MLFLHAFHPVPKCPPNLRLVLPLSNRPACALWTVLPSWLPEPDILRFILLPTTAVDFRRFAVPYTLPHCYVHRHFFSAFLQRPTYACPLFAHARRITTYAESNILDYYISLRESCRSSDVLSTWALCWQNSQAYARLAETDVLLQRHHYALPSRRCVGRKTYPTLEQLKISGSLYDQRVCPPLNASAICHSSIVPGLHPPSSRAPYPKHLEIVDILNGEKVPDEPRNRVESAWLKSLVFGRVSRSLEPQCNWRSLVARPRRRLDSTTIFALLERLPLRRLSMLTLGGVVYGLTRYMRTPANTGARRLTAFSLLVFFLLSVAGGYSACASMGWMSGSAGLEYVFNGDEGRVERVM